MKKSDELKSQRAGVLDKMEELISDSQKRGGDFTHSEEATFDQLKKEADQINRQLSVEILKEERASEKASKIKSNADFERSTAYGAAAIQMAGGRTNNELVRATVTTGSGSGKAFAPDVISASEFLDGLHNSYVLNDAGVRNVQITGDSYSIPKLNNPATATWAAEGSTITENTPTFQSVTFTPKTVISLVKISNQLLNAGVGSMVEMAIQNEINRSLGEAIQAAIFDNTTTNGVSGILSFTDASAINTGTTPAVDQSISDFSNLVNAKKLIRRANVTGNLSAIMHSDVHAQFGALADTTGQPLQMPSYLSDMSLYSSNEIPTNLGAGTDETRILVGDFSQLVIGTRASVSMRLVEKYADEYSTAFLVAAELDAMPLYGPAFCVISEVTA